MNAQLSGSSLRKEEPYETAMLTISFSVVLDEFLTSSTIRKYRNTRNLLHCDSSKLNAVLAPFHFFSI